MSLVLQGLFLALDAGADNLNALQQKSVPAITIETPSAVFYSGIQQVGTADETVNMGEVATPGMVCIRNLDAENYVEIGKASADYVIKLEAGEWMLARWNTAAIHAKANTAAVNIEVFIVNS